MTKVHVAMGLLAAGSALLLADGRAQAQCCHGSSMMGGMQQSMAQQYAAQQQYALQQIAAMQQQALLQQYAQQQYALQQQPSINQSALRSQSKPKAQPLQTIIEPSRQSVSYATTYSDSSTAAAPVDEATASERNATFRLSATKSLMKAGKTDAALRFAKQLVLSHPNTPQATEARGIIKALTVVD